jgi:GNAT superfamily N-acetyltransferase
MNSNFQIKQLSAFDAAALSKIALKAYNDHYLHLWFDNGDWYKNKSFATQALAAELSNSNSLFYIIYDNNEEAGFLKLNINEALAPFSAGDCMELERIYLTTAASGKGIGSFLMNHTLETAKQFNKKILWLKVMDSSTGPISFYQKKGFEICGTTQLSFELMKPELRGMHIMKKHIQ